MKKKDNRLAEYLFLDKPRIERYFQQLSEPVKYDKLPVWKIALSLTGPAVEGTQTHPGREFSFQEKLQKVLDHIQGNGLLSGVRPSLFNEAGREFHSEKTPFIAETLSARQARIEREGKILTIWVSLQPNTFSSDNRFQPTALYLIEDFRGDDEFPSMRSAYSSLWLLAGELRWTNSPSLVSSINELRKQDATSHFAIDPIGSLKSIGAEFGPERDIHTIYRFRASCFDKYVESLTTIGYPLLIREA